MGKYKVEVGQWGGKFWHLNGKLHRDVGPADEAFDGAKVWWFNGKLHREEGPAVIYVDGANMWYLDDEQLTEIEHAKRMSNE